MAEAVYEKNGGFFVDDDLLNFELDGEEVDEQREKKENENSSSSSSYSSSCLLSEHLDRSFPPVFVEEELEWLSNKDAFPAVETCFDILSVSDNPNLALDYDSPVSVLENSSSSSDSKNSGNSSGSTLTSCCGGFLIPINYPVRKRSRRRRRQRAGFLDFPSQENLLNQLTVKNNKQDLVLPPLPLVRKTSTSIGRRCLHCLSDKTPQWRAGPMGPKTLCNACGVRYKSGRLVPEYRPASSPTFSAALHSNSHRKIIEMRRQKQMIPGGTVVNQDCGYNVA